MDKVVKFQFIKIVVLKLLSPSLILSCMSNLRPFVIGVSYVRWDFKMLAHFPEHLNLEK